jgi:3-methyladenine DNA glycosylase Mpg
LTRAFGIDGSVHGQRFLDAANRGIFRGPTVAVTTGERIGISRAQTHPWRFHEGGNIHVSR